MGTQTWIDPKNRIPRDEAGVRRTHRQILHIKQVGRKRKVRRPTAQATSLCLSKRWPHLKNRKKACEDALRAFERALREFRLKFDGGLGLTFGGNRNDACICLAFGSAGESAAELPHQIPNLGCERERRDGARYREEDRIPVSPECSAHWSYQSGNVSDQAYGMISALTQALSRCPLISLKYAASPAISLQRGNYGASDNRGLVRLWPHQVSKHNLPVRTPS